MKPFASIFLSDSITSRVEIENSHFESFVRGKENDGVATFTVKTYNLQKFVCKSGVNKNVFHFVFSGWKISDGITPQMWDIILRSVVEMNIVKIFLVVGVNDIR